MKKSLLFTFMLVCLMALNGCKKHEVYKYTGSHEYFEINDCYIEIYDDTSTFHGGKLNQKGPSQFKDITAYTIKQYLQFDDGYVNSFKTMTVTSDDSSSALNLNGLKLVDSSVDRWIFKNPDATLWFEIEIVDANGNENTYKVEMIKT